LQSWLLLFALLFSNKSELIWLIQENLHGR
jgi:hypothetical protein